MAESYFPTPLPEESVYSLVSRYHLFRSNPAPKDTFQELFGVESMPIAGLHGRLGHLQQRSAGALESVQAIADHHTILPALRLVLTPEKYREAINQAGGDDPLGPQKILKSTAVANADALLFCPACRAADPQPYWRRYWSVPGVTVCVDHLTRLRRPTCGRCRFGTSSRRFRCPPSECLCGAALGAEAGQVSSRAAGFATIARQLLSWSGEVHHLQAALEAHRKQLRRGFLLENVRAISKDLYKHSGDKLDAAGRLPWLERWAIAKEPKSLTLTQAIWFVSFEGDTLDRYVERFKALPAIKQRWPNARLKIERQKRPDRFPPDEELAELVKKTADRLKASPARFPFRITGASLGRALRLGGTPWLRPNYPRTKTAVKWATESPDKYTERCIRWAIHWVRKRKKALDEDHILKLARLKNKDRDMVRTVIAQVTFDPFS